MTKDEVLAIVKKNPIGVGCGALSLVLGALIYFRGGELPAAEEDLAQKSDEAARFAANLQNAAQLKEQTELMAAATKELESRLVHVTQTLNNYQFFYKLVGETGVKMTVLTQAPTPAAKAGQKATFLAVPFSITVMGTLPQMFDYLRRLESGARYCRVTSATCSVPIADRGSPLTFAINLELLGQP